MQFKVTTKNYVGSSDSYWRRWFVCGDLIWRLISSLRPVIYPAQTKQQQQHALASEIEWQLAAANERRRNATIKPKLI